MIGNPRLMELFDHDVCNGYMLCVYVLVPGNVLRLPANLLMIHCHDFFDPARVTFSHAHIGPESPDTVLSDPTSLSEVVAKLIAIRV